MDGAEQPDVVDRRGPPERQRLDVIELKTLRAAAQPTVVKPPLAPAAIALPHLPPDVRRDVLRLRRPELRLRVLDEPLPLRRLGEEQVEPGLEDVLDGRARPGRLRLLELLRELGADGDVQPALLGGERDQLRRPRRGSRRRTNGRQFIWPTKTRSRLGFDGRGGGRGGELQQRSGRCTSRSSASPRHWPTAPIVNHALRAPRTSPPPPSARLRRAGPSSLPEPARRSRPDTEHASARLRRVRQM
jgi:hypothetical protein